MQHVADDYAKRLSIGQFAAYDVIAQVISDIITPKNIAVQPLLFCPLLNEVRATFDNLLTLPRAIAQRWGC